MYGNMYVGNLIVFIDGVVKLLVLVDIFVYDVVILFMNVFLELM